MMWHLCRVDTASVEARYGISCKIGSAHSVRMLFPSFITVGKSIVYLKASQNRVFAGKHMLRCQYAILGRCFVRYFTLLVAGKKVVNDRSSKRAHVLLSVNPQVPFSHQRLCTLALFEDRPIHCMRLKYAPLTGAKVWMKTKKRRGKPLRCAMSPLRGWVYHHSNRYKIATFFQSDFEHPTFRGLVSIMSYLYCSRALLRKSR